MIRDNQNGYFYENKSLSNAEHIHFSEVTPFPFLILTHTYWVLITE